MPKHLFVPTRIVPSLSVLSTDSDEKSKFADCCLKQYRDVPAFNPKNYDL